MDIRKFGIWVEIRVGDAYLQLTPGQAREIADAVEEEGDWHGRVGDDGSTAAAGLLAGKPRYDGMVDIILSGANFPIGFGVAEKVDPAVAATLHFRLRAVASKIEDEEAVA